MIEFIFPAIKKDVVVDSVLFDYFLEEVDIAVVILEKESDRVRSNKIKKVLTNIVFEKNCGDHNLLECSKWADVVEVKNGNFLQALKEMLVLADGKYECSIKELLEDEKVVIL